MTMQETPQKQFSLDEIVKVHTRLKDEKARINREADKAVKEIDKKMLTLESVLARKLLENGAENMRTKSGTFYREEVMIPSCNDWPTAYKFMADTDSFEMLEKRITKKFVQAYMEANGEPPPGVSVLREWKVRVRRSSEE